MPFEGKKCVNKTEKSKEFNCKIFPGWWKTNNRSKQIKTGKSVLNNENSNNLYFNNKHEYLCQQ